MWTGATGWIAPLPVLLVGILRHSGRIPRSRWRPSIRHRHSVGLDYQAYQYRVADISHLGTLEEIATGMSLAMNCPAVITHSGRSLCL